MTNLALTRSDASYAGLYDHLKLPSGRIVGQVNNEELRAELARFPEIADVHTAGRNTLLQRYAMLLMTVGDRASEKAIAEFLQSKKA